jgi:ferredoxin/flavodoxin
MRRAAILYRSGTGGTRLVAEILGELLSSSVDCAVAGIEEGRAPALAAASDILVLCYPTYYLKAPPSMRAFAVSLGPFDPPRAAYLLTTCELYTENSIRAFALSLKKRGLLVAGSKVVHAPGSDLACVLPGALAPGLYRFEAGFPAKLRVVAAEIEAIALALAEGRAPLEAIPGPRWYTPFTQLFQVLALNRFDGFRSRMRVLRDRCTSCGACVKGCHRGAFAMGETGIEHDGELCELCTRCIHRCPSRAIVLLEALKDNRRLDALLFARLKAETREALGLGSRAQEAEDDSASSSERMVAR